MAKKSRTGSLDRSSLDADSLKASPFTEAMRATGKAIIMEIELAPSLLVSMLLRSLPVLMRMKNNICEGTEWSSRQLSIELKNLQLLYEVSPDRFPSSKNYC